MVEQEVQFKLGFSLAKNNRFSERIGKSPPKPIQIAGMDQDLFNSIWNTVVRLQETSVVTHGGWPSLASDAAGEVLKERRDGVPHHPLEARQWLRKHLTQLHTQGEWYRVYDFVEYFVSADPYSDYLHKQFNKIFEREMSGYRFVSRVLTPISNEAEAKEIEEAANRSKKSGLEGVQEHLDSALRLLGRKPEPDYRNAIKESVSAVESVVKQLSRTKGGGLDAALEELNKRTPIHGSLRSGFKKLYGYTSNEDGIRHAILKKKDVGYDEAKFMVVSCSAFVNFLIGKAEKAGLLPK